MITKAVDAALISLVVMATVLTIRSPRLHGFQTYAFMGIAWFGAAYLIINNRSHR